MKKINRGIVILGIIILFVSCKNSGIIAFQNPDQYFQLLISGQELLNAMSTQGDGAQKLQLYNANSQELSEVTMPNLPYTVTQWKRDTIKVELLISDTSAYFPWFRENKTKPVNIGRYKIFYSLKINEGTSLSSKYHIDSLSYDKNQSRVHMYSNDSLIYKHEIQSLFIFPYKVIQITPDRVFEFYVKDKDAIDSFLKQIRSVYIN